MSEKKETKTTSVPVDPWSDLVPIKLFKDNANYKNDVFAAVNGHSYLIKRGVKVEVPRCIAEVIENSEQQRQRTSLLVNQMEQEYSRKDS